VLWSRTPWAKALIALSEAYRADTYATVLEVAKSAGIADPEVIRHSWLWLFCFLPQNWAAQPPARDGAQNFDSIDHRNRPGGDHGDGMGRPYVRGPR
jgi:hypothetical protein